VTSDVRWLSSPGAAGLVIRLRMFRYFVGRRSASQRLSGGVQGRPRSPISASVECDPGGSPSHQDVGHRLIASVIGVQSGFLRQRRARLNRSRLRKRRRRQQFCEGFLARRTIILRKHPIASIEPGSMHPKNCVHREEMLRRVLAGGG